MTPQVLYMTALDQFCSAQFLDLPILVLAVAASCGGGPYLVFSSSKLYTFWAGVHGKV